ncbi:MAG: HAD family hydrolase [Anaerolineae bacterium]|jgi:HAD superfamily hydrolase (TIGR01509 family)|nr:HAD family hydrolase [Anaerolineae bacterium]
MALDLARVRALCFDVDGTLSDTDDLWVRRFAAMFEPFRIFFPHRQVEPFARWVVMGIETPGNLVYSLLDRLHLDDEAARLINALSRWRKASRHHSFLLIPGVEHMLERLHGRFPLAVVSARDEASTLAFLEQFDLRRYFSSIVSAQSCAYTKPFPHPVRKAAEELGVPASACLMIGDTTVDLRAGQAAGAQTVGVLCGFGRRGELERHQADLVLENTAFLADLLLGTE